MKAKLKLLVMATALIAFGFGGTALTFRDGSATGSNVLNSYYDRETGPVFSVSQRSLCDKCHVK